MSVQVKICGLNEVAGLEAARSADWIGLNFFAASPRFVTPRQARALLDAAGGHPPAIGLFVRPSEAAIAEALDEVPLDGLQLYTDHATAAALRARFGLPVWLAQGVSAPANLPGPEDVAGIDGLVVESRAPAGAAMPGGNGLSFDHTLLRGWQAPVPWLLAGGLTPDNVATAIAVSGAPGVDVSSGVESAPGRKAPELIAAFIARARAHSAPPAGNGPDTTP